MAADNLDWHEFRQVVHAVAPEAEEAFMTIAEQLRQQGLQQGQRELLIEQLRMKFGELDDRTLRQLEIADAAALMRYAQRVLRAADLEEVFSL
jgi:hypothetical protein